MEERLIFKSYLRKLLKALKEIKEALQIKDYEKAEKLINGLIEDTEKGIADK